MREGTFREDLFFRLRVVEIVIPPLRERVEDIPLMAAKFLREFSKENNKSVTALDRSTLELLQKYPWPGNVRELRACMEHAVIFSSGSSVQVRDLPPSIKNWQPETVMIGAPLMSPTDSHPAQTTTQTTKRGSNLSVKEAEKQLIFRALEECGGNRTAAALKLGISRRTLHRKLNEYQMQHL